MDIVILDTNVLLVDPDSLMSYPDKEIVLPEIIFSELDKLKIARTDSDTRYQGRELSRKLFELSSGKSFQDGIELENGGRLRVASFDTDIPLPEGFSSKNPDDRVIVTALRLVQSCPDRTVTLITNDLNMLLKAQQLGIPIERHDADDKISFVKRFITRPFQKYRVPIIILIVAIAVFVATIIIAVNTTARNQDTVLPSEYRNFLTTQQSDGLDALIKLQSDPKDVESLYTVAELYYTYYQNAAASGDSANALSFAKKGVSYFSRYLSLKGDDVETRVQQAALEFYTGDTAAANNDLNTALSANPDSVNANYTAGIVAMQGNHDYGAAATYFQKTIDLCDDDPAYTSIKDSASSYLTQVQTEQESLTNPTSGGASV